MNFKTIIALVILISITAPAQSQSPKKYFENGYYEQAFVEAAYKQNKKVKLKKKHVDVILDSYVIIYSKHSATILSPDYDWNHSYDRLIRMVKFRAKVKHPGVYDKLTNILYDKAILDYIASKFNEENLEDIKVAESYEAVTDYDKAFEIYQGIAARHKQAEPITTLEDRLIIIDYESKIEVIHEKIGDQIIEEAKELINGGSKKGAYTAIDLIEEARTHRPLSVEEEELLSLANLIIGDQWIIEAEKLVKTRTKKNARLAYELINRASTFRPLTADEERLQETAEYLGMTRIMVKVEGGDPIHNTKSLSGLLNKGKSSRWVTYYFETDDSQVIDYEMQITENKPTVVLGDVRKKITQNSKTVEYYEDETDAEGNTTSVKKTRLAIAMVTVISRTKTANLDWAITVKRLSDSQAVYSESRETRIELTNEYASLTSGDVLALPENIETDVDLDSQPFPEDEDMLNQVEDQYISELMNLVAEQVIYIM